MTLFNLRGNAPTHNHSSLNFSSDDSPGDMKIGRHPTATLRLGALLVVGLFLGSPAFAQTGASVSTEEEVPVLSFESPDAVPADSVPTGSLPSQGIEGDPLPTQVPSEAERQAQNPPAPTSSRTQVPPASASPVDAPPVEVSLGLEEAVRAYEESGAAPPILTQGLSRRVPYGHEKPTLRCNQLISCLIMLQPGETVRHTVAGDPKNWNISLASMGPGGVTPLVVVKPVFPLSDLRTNLFVMTDKRIYEVALEAEGIRDRRPVGDPSRLNVLEFYYPDEMVRTWHREANAERQAAEAAALRATTGEALDLSPRIALSDMNHSYKWKKDKRFPWEPAAVFDDGRHVYITLEDGARYDASATLFARGLDGSNVMLEYAVRGGRIITDRVFREAVFIYSEPSRRKKLKKYELVIENTSR
jgi:type IV secretory pathway VirB9-like protein